MNISDFIKANAATSLLSASSVTQAKGVGLGLQKAEQRIQAQVDTTSAQLSSLGKLKSAVSDAQIGASKLAGLSATTTSAAIKTAATSFVAAFNAALTAAKSTASTSDDIAVSQSANRAGKDLVRSVSDDKTTLDALKQAGISLGSDGKLALDSKKLDVALNSNGPGLRGALVKLGQHVTTTATTELASQGNVGQSLASLNQRSGILKSQQATLASLSQNAQSLAGSSSSNLYGISSFFGS
jgi:hypothetical protein